MFRNRLIQSSGRKPTDSQSVQTDTPHPTSVANGITVMMELFTGLAFILILALSMTIFGCGKKEQQSSVTPVSIKTESPTNTPTPEPTIVTPVVDLPTEPSEPEVVTFAKAEEVFNSRDYAEATELFKAYTEQNDSNAWGHYMLGLSSKRSGDLYNAEVAFRRATELDPKHVKSLLNLSRVLIDDERPQEALDELDRAMELDPESGAALRLQGRAFHNLGWLDDAKFAYRAAIVIDTTDAWSMNNLALIQLEQEEYLEALAALSRTIELRDDVAIFFNNLGMALEHTGHTRDAQDAYDSALALDADHAKAAINFARVEGIEQDDSITPADFETLAQAFVEQIRIWNEEALASEDANMVELEEGILEVSVADTSGVPDPEEF